MARKALIEAYLVARQDDPQMAREDWQESREEVTGLLNAVLDEHVHGMARELFAHIQDGAPQDPDFRRGLLYAHDWMKMRAIRTDRELP